MPVASEVVNATRYPVPHDTPKGESVVPRGGCNAIMVTEVSVPLSVASFSLMCVLDAYNPGDRTPRPDDEKALAMEVERSVDAQSVHLCFPAPWF